MERSASRVGGSRSMRRSGVKFRCGFGQTATFIRPKVRGRSFSLATARESRDFRSHLKAREKVRGARNWLIFGERNAAYDSFLWAGH